jgi:putative membrane protein
MSRPPFLALAWAIAVAVLPFVPDPLVAQAIVDPARSADSAFIAKATEATRLDAELATLAATRATAADVKAFAKQVLGANVAIARELAALAGTRQIAIAPRRDAAAKVIATLSSQPPGAFDPAFLAAMIASRDAAVALFDAESRDGRDDEVKEWAARQLPALRDHLTSARTLRPRKSS